MDSRKKVLCVDDEVINLYILKKILGKKFEIITAQHGQEALDILEKDKEISLVVSDMKMPEMSGLEFIKTASSRFTNIKYFMLSGYAITDEIQEALDSKLITKYFEKPANFEKIEKTLEENC
jgi:CheY-like chemotaxis protein